MLDIRYIRDNLELCKTAAINKNREVDWDALLRLDEKRRELIGVTEKLRGERNKLTREQQQRGKEIKLELKKVDDELRSAEEQFNLLMLTVPNVPDASVPVGKDETGNVEVKKWPARNASASVAGGEKRIVLGMKPTLAPTKIAVFPLVANKPELMEKAQSVFAMLSKQFRVAWDARGNIGKRYLSQDEVGTPWCITVDYTTLDDNTVTVRDRDTTEQVRMNIDELSVYFQKQLGIL